MKIVLQSATLLEHTPEPQKLIERVGRICYKSEGAITPDSHKAFVRGLIAKGHESVLEHPSATILVVCDRGVSHELVRQRPTSQDDVPDCESTWLKGISQESTRYCNYSKDKFGNEISVIEPVFVGGPEQRAIARAEWVEAMKDAERHYFRLIEQGQPAEVARGVLPINLKAEVAVTANLREWRVILRQRTSPKAHPMMREVMAHAKAALLQLAPDVFGDLA